MAGLLGFLAARLRWIPLGTPGRIATGAVVGGLAVKAGVFIADRLQSGSDHGPEPPPAASASLGKLACILDGDVWVRSLPSGSPVQLTNEGIYTHPRWSPSGEWLAIGDPAGTALGDGRVTRYPTIMRADGRDLHYASGCGAWSPVDDVLACMLSNNHLRLETGAGVVVGNFDLPALFARKKDIPVG
jgi:hypothetical protein